MNNAKENLEMVKAAGTAGFESIRTLGELNLRTWEKLVEKQMDTFGLFIDTGIKQLSLSTEITDAKDLVNTQVELAKAFGESLAAKGRETVEIANSVRDEYQGWLEDGVKKLNETAKTAA
jgi:hypothetical protein